MKKKRVMVGITQTDGRNNIMSYSRLHSIVLDSGSLFESARIIFSFEKGRSEIILN